MEINYQYQKKRSEFGRQCLFSDKGPDLVDNYPPDKKLARNYILKDPVHRSTQLAPIQASHELNTMRAEYANAAVNHYEGGWPKDVNMLDEEQTKRYRRKIEKDEAFQHTMMQLFKNMENCILQNNAINIYQQYFSDVDPTPIVERSSARTVNVYQDQCTPQRPITHISWSPDNQSKLAITHCDMHFQAYIHKDKMFSYIWEVGEFTWSTMLPCLVDTLFLNKLKSSLRTHSSITCLEYNLKDPYSLVSGLLSGQVAVWDTRKGTDPVELSVVEDSFRDPVRNVKWIHSKTGTDFFSCSSDGQVKWWDVRKVSQPTETLIVDYSKDEDQTLANAYCPSTLEYEMTIPTRFMVGTEEGLVISCNRKGKTALEKMSTRFSAHLGPVLSVQRNPGFVKNFLTIGDWTAKIFAEDVKESPIMWTSYHKARLTDGAWSPTRLSVFVTTRSDGILDVWDILQQQKQSSLRVKVCDEALTTLRMHEMGRLVAVGNQKGTTYLVEFSENLSVLNKNDKMLLTAMFDRENRREKILEARNREIRLKQKTKQPAAAGEEEAEEGDAEGETAAEGVFADKYVKQAEADFYQFIRTEVRPPKSVEAEEEEEEEEEEGEEETEKEDEELLRTTEPVGTPKEEPQKGKKM